MNALPPLDAETYAALKADIAAHGVLQPVIEDEYGQILDGHHRARIADELGMKYPVTIVGDLSVDEREVLGLTLNLHRRQLNASDRKAVLKRLVKIKGVRPQARPRVRPVPEDQTSTSNDPFAVPVTHEAPTLDEYASEFGVSRSTIERDLRDGPKAERSDTDKIRGYMTAIVYNARQMAEVGFANTEPDHHRGWHEDLTGIASLLTQLADKLSSP